MIDPARIRRFAALLMTPLVLAACATTIPEVSPDDIPSLREQVAADPTDATAATRLGIALYRADDYEGARDVLAVAEENGSGIGAAHLYLGLAHEGLEEWSAAREAYQRYLDTGRYGPLQDRIRNRLQLMVRRELQAEAAAAIQQEQALSNTEPAPRSIAVLPFRLIGDAPQLEPLRIALADMMITDLSYSNALTVLERTRIQALLDEMAMTEAGLTDEGTGARTGRLLQAEHVVQGAITTLGSDQIRLDADVLSTVRAASAGEIGSEDQLQAIFDLEKAAVFQVLDVLGVQLTPAERQAIDENRSTSLLAFLAYGEGLQALDRGDYAAATAAFGQSAQLDPGFAAAEVQSSEAAALQDAEQTSQSDIAQQGSNELAGGTIGGAPPPQQTAGAQLSNTLANIGNGVNPNPNTGQIDLGTPGGTGGDGAQGGTGRDPVQEAGGNEGTAQPTTARIRITIPRPGGGE